MKKILVLLALTILFLAPTSTNGDEIRASEDGRYIIVPVETFRVRQADLEKYDASLEYIAALEKAISDLRDQLIVAQVALDRERRASGDQLRKARGPGFGVSAIATTEGELRVGAGFVWRLF